MTNSRPIDRIDFIDFAKGFSILTIVFYHYLQRSATGIMANAIELGGSGVHLFLILSGFGLCLSSGSFSALAFYKRRFIKVLIPYYIYVTFLFILNQFIVFFPTGDLYAYLGHIFWYKMFDKAILGSFTYPLWFLSVIIQFYLFFPLLFLLKQRLGSRFFVALTTGISVLYWIAVLLLGQEANPVFTHFFLQYLWEFCLGMVLADLYTQKGYRFWQQKLPVSAVAAIVGIGLMGVLALKGGRAGSLLNDFPAAIGYTALVICFYTICLKIGPFLIRCFKAVGRISYELYLVHPFVAIVVVKVLYNQAQLRLTYTESLLIAPVALLAAALYSLLMARILPTRRS